MRTKSIYKIAAEFENKLRKMAMASDDDDGSSEEDMKCLSRGCKETAMRGSESGYCRYCASGTSPDDDDPYPCECKCGCETLIYVGLRCPLCLRGHHAETEDDNGDEDFMTTDEIADRLGNEEGY